jgi:hypothetical protein
METNNIEKKYNNWIIALSIIIPVAVAVLFKVKLKDLGFNVSPMPILPPIYATINGITAVLLISAVMAIKNGNRKLHELLMKVAIGCSLVFLVLYIVYHMTTDSTPYGGTGALKFVYEAFQSNVKIGKEIAAVWEGLNAVGTQVKDAIFGLTRSLAYAVEANYTSFSDTGFWGVYLATDPKNMDKAIALAKKEISRLCVTGLSTAQLHRAKEQLKGHFALGMDSNLGLMLGLGKSLLAFNQIDTIKDIHAGIDRITSQELLTIANTYFSPDLISELVFDCKKNTK